MRTLISATAVLLAVSGQTDAAYTPAECSKTCVDRVKRRIVREQRWQVRQEWRIAVAGYGPALLRARMECESGGDGGYRLRTTGNGYWFAFQFNVGAWTGAGGRFARGRPAGRWTRQPGPLEQQFRAVRWDRIHGGDPWPNCP